MELNKVVPIDRLIDAVSSARCLSFGGGEHRRKPMAAVSALARSDVGPFDVDVFLGGPDVDLLIGYGKVRRLQFAFMGIGPLGLLPNFRKAREKDNDIEIVESSEYLILAGFEAAAHGVPFMPTKSGLGTDVLTRPNTPYRLMECPLTGETLVAVPASRIDVAVMHVNVADRRGNCLVFGDPFVDELLSRAAKQVWITAEKVVDQLPPMDDRPAHQFISRVWVTGVVEAPNGAGFTGTYPDSLCDLDAAAEYQAHATDPAWRDGFTDDAVCSFEGAAR
jgi:glutaconate CoA-transferase subunit A